MLHLHSDQMLAFEQTALLKFEAEVLSHAMTLSPRLCHALGEARVSAALRPLLARARAHGFTNRGPLLLFVELAFLLGSHFDTDPQYDRLGRLLRLPIDQMQRAENMHLFALDYVDRVCGIDNVNVQRAMADTSDFVRDPPILRENFVADMADELIGIFPEKVMFLGEQCLEPLVRASSDLAQDLGLREPRQHARLAALMFVFGHGCMADPLRPGVERMLADALADAPTGATPPTWIEHALAARPVLPT